jgi:essential nuclear protein 1
MDGEPSQAPEKSDPYAVLDPKIVELYTKSVCRTIDFYVVIDVLSLVTRVGLAMRGKGPLVKPMKILPTLSQWAPCLSLTSPEQWSPYSCRMATKVFISSMKPEQARIYLHFVLLNAVRTDIADNNKLNVHYYEALIRAMYKPAAFFKGIVFPFLEVRAPALSFCDPDTERMYLASPDRLQFKRSCNHRIRSGQKNYTIGPPGCSHN